MSFTTDIKEIPFFERGMEFLFGKVFSRSEVGKRSHLLFVNLLNQKFTDVKKRLICN